jgi:hypothetical protein
MAKGKKSQSEKRKVKSPWINLVANPLRAPTALPPVDLGTPYVPRRLHFEVLLSTDGSGNVGAYITDCLGECRLLGTVGSDGVVAGSSATAHPDIAAHTLDSVFGAYIPLCTSVKATYVGPADECSGTFYGVSSTREGDINYTSLHDHRGAASTSPSDGMVVSFTSGSSRWYNPTALSASRSTILAAGGLINFASFAFVGLPANKANCVRLEIIHHVAGSPSSGSYAAPDAVIAVPHSGVHDAASTVAKIQHGAHTINDFLDRAERVADAAVRSIGDAAGFMASWGPVIGSVAEYALPLLL